MAKAKIEKKAEKKTSKKTVVKPEIIKRRLYVKPESKNKGGAPCKFDQFNEEIITRTRAGSSKKDRIGGLIHDNTYIQWTKAGEEDLRAGILSQYSEFLLKIRQAENEFRDQLRALIKEHAPNDWKAAAWLLERSDPESYKLRDKMDVKQEIEVSQKAILELPDNGDR